MVKHSAAVIGWGKFNHANCHMLLLQDVLLYQLAQALFEAFSAYRVKGHFLRMCFILHKFYVFINSVCVCVPK